MQHDISHRFSRAMLSIVQTVLSQGVRPSVCLSFSPSACHHPLLSKH